MTNIQPGIKGNRVSIPGQWQDFSVFAKRSDRLRGECRPRQTRQIPRAVDLKGRFLFLVIVKC
jgi:hypothetical protein